jgi:hypothetical protein
MAKQGRAQIRGRPSMRVVMSWEWRGSWEWRDSRETSEEQVPGRVKTKIASSRRSEEEGRVGGWKE